MTRKHLPSRWTLYRRVDCRTCRDAFWFVTKELEKKAGASAAVVSGCCALTKRSSPATTSRTLERVSGFDFCNFSLSDK
jgi:hypothetical protein